MTDDSYSSTHPPLPPTTEDDRLLWLRLLRSRRVGIATFWRLLGEHGSAARALASLPAVARDAGLSDYATFSEKDALAEMNRARACGARMVCWGEANYPKDLAALSDAPPILWLRGSAEQLNRPMIALVGARNASSLGARMARRLAGELGAAGFCVVSGLARGIDAEAHRATLKTGTVAVLAGGVDVLYPVENAPLGDEIYAEGGALISEQPLGLKPQSRHFPTRNRIVSGLARAVVVIEAAAKSGSLITARNALDQGREVLAVPGHPLDPRASGCNMLIRDGACLVRSADDVLEVLEGQGLVLPDAFESPSRSDPARPALVEARQTQPQPHPVDPVSQPASAPSALRRVASLHQDILARLGPAPLAEDQLVRDLGLAARQIAPALTDLELKGEIERAPGGLLARPGDGSGGTSR